MTYAFELAADDPSRIGERAQQATARGWPRWRASREPQYARVIDLHSHLLPGVNDGSPSVAVSVEVLTRFASDGVETVVCTPHLRASKAAEAPHAAYAAIFDTLAAAAPGPPSLLRGWEIMLDVPGIDLRRQA